MRNDYPPSTFEAAGHPQISPRFATSNSSSLTVAPAFSAPTATPVPRFEAPTATRADIDLVRLEQCLRKALFDFTYDWPTTHQSRELDALTAFIYFERRWWSLEAHLVHWKDLPKYRDLLQYARVRWINYWSAQGVEAILNESRCVTLNPDPCDAEWDFSFTSGGFHALFDHKTTCWPRRWSGSVEDAIRDPRPLVEWLYTNQRTQSHRCQSNNRFFVILHASDGLHWNLKAELSLIRQHVWKWLRHPYHFDVTLKDGQVVTAAAVIVTE